VANYFFVVGIYPHFHCSPSPCEPKRSRGGLARGINVRIQATTSRELMKKKSPTASSRKAPATPVVLRKRKRGRPQSGHAKVGQDTIVAAARQLIEKLRPHQVTIARIAREAGVDPALVRYYFKNREQLLLAVVENILADWAVHPTPDEAPAAQIGKHLANMFAFSRSVRSMQRLMVEECAEAKSPAVRARARS
jgi:hypothetical protein